jgi:hypothetical protein
MMLGPGEILLGVRLETDPQPNLLGFCLCLFPSLPSLYQGTPTRLAMGPLPSGRVSSGCIPFEGSDPLLGRRELGDVPRPAHAGEDVVGAGVKAVAAGGDGQGLVYFAVCAVSISAKVTYGLQASVPHRGLAHMRAR